MILLQLFLGCILQLTPFAFLCLYAFNNHLRFSLRKTVLFTLAVLLAVTLMFSLAGTYLASVLPAKQILFQAINMVFMCCLLPCFFWYLYAVKAIWQKKLFVFSFALTSALSITSVCNCICTRIYSHRTVNGLPYNGYSSLIILLVTATALPLLVLLIRYCYLPVEDGLNAKECGYLSALSILLFALHASGLFYISYGYLLQNLMALFLYFMLIIMVFVIYAVIFRMYSFAHEKYVIQERYLQMKRQIDLRDEQYLQIHESMERSRKMRHDLRLHVLTLNGFLNNNEIDEIRKYLEQYLETAPEYEIHKFCANPIVNMLMGHYYALAKENNIGFVIRIDIPKELPMQTPDISVLLGNLLENAVEAADHAPETYRSIQLNMICSGKMLAITVDNGFDGNIRRNGKHYLSTKPNHSGLGLKSLADTAKKYDGAAEFSHDGMIFHSSVMVRLFSETAS